MAMVVGIGMAMVAPAEGQSQQGQPPRGQEEAGVDVRMLADLEILRDLELLRQLEVLRRIEEIRSEPAQRSRKAGEKGKP
jgi:hypothetical protein